MKMKKPLKKRKRRKGAYFVEEARRVNIYMDGKTLEKAYILGERNISRGFRMAFIILEEKGFLEKKS